MRYFKHIYGAIMDIKFETGEEVFSVGVRAMILNGDKILAMRDENLPYHYLPGGKVEVGETAEEAVLR